MVVEILNQFFLIKESKITRRHNYTLVKKQSILDVRKYSLPQRRCRLKLSDDVNAEMELCGRTKLANRFRLLPSTL